MLAQRTLSVRAFNGAHWSSIGIATLKPDTRRRPKLLINAADRALYKAKSEGRNRAFAVAA